MNKKQLQKLAFKGHYYTLEFKGVTKSEAELLKAIHAIFCKADDGGDWQDVRSFDGRIKALLPEGYVSGGGSHHIWIHRADDLGQPPGVPDFGIWVFQDPQLYYKYIDGLIGKGK
jgi:hypothetical protein